MITNSLYWLYSKGYAAITSGGYTYLVDEGRGLYFACGTFPGCVRGGEIMSKESLQKSRFTYKRIDLKGLIKNHGFFPCPFTMPIIFRLQVKWKELDFHLTDLVEYSISYGNVSELKHPFRSPKIWQEYFKKRGV